MTTYSISIGDPSDPYNNVFWEKQVPKDEFDRVRGYCVQRKVWSPGSAMLVPVRTNKWKNFAKDFFFPTVRMLYEDRRRRLMIYAVFAALDVLTFPARVITVIPRIFANAIKPEHQLHRYLREENAGAEALQSDYVCVTLADRKGGRASSRFTTINFVEIPVPLDWSFTWGGSTAAIRASSVNNVSDR